MTPLLKYREAAKVLGVTERTVWAMVDRGTLPAVRFGRSVRIDPADLRAFIEETKRGSSVSALLGERAEARRGGAA
jgi:excisionase family DNA binding protein